MTIFEIVSAIVLIIACVFIVIVVLVKDTKTQMSQTVSGTSSDSFYQKNSGRTKEAMLNKATIAAAVIFFVLAVAVNVINIYWGGSKDEVGDSASVGVAWGDDNDTSIPDDVLDSLTASDNSSESSSESSTSAQ